MSEYSAEAYVPERYADVVRQAATEIEDIRRSGDVAVVTRAIVRSKHAPIDTDAVDVYSNTRPVKKFTDISKRQVGIVAEAQNRGEGVAVGYDHGRSAGSIRSAWVDDADMSSLWHDVDISNESVGHGIAMGEIGQASLEHQIFVTPGTGEETIKPLGLSFTREGRRPNTRVYPLEVKRVPISAAQRAAHQRMSETQSTAVAPSAPAAEAAPQEVPAPVADATVDAKEEPQTDIAIYQQLMSHNEAAAATNEALRKQLKDAEERAQKFEKERLALIAEKEALARAQSSRVDTDRREIRDFYASLGDVDQAELDSYLSTLVDPNQTSAARMLMVASSRAIANARSEGTGRSSRLAKEFSDYQRRTGHAFQVSGVASAESKPYPVAQMGGGLVIAASEGAARAMRTSKPVEAANPAKRPRVDLHLPPSMRAPPSDTGLLSMLMD